MDRPEKKWMKYISRFGGKKSVSGEHHEQKSISLKHLDKASLPERTQQKSFKVLRDLILVFFFFALAFVLTSVLDLHNSFEAASVELKDSPFQ